MKRNCFAALALLGIISAVAAAQNSAQLTPDGSCETCRQNGLFPRLNAMLASHRSQSQYASYGYGGSCQKGCCQKGCVQKGCVQKGCCQKGCVQKPCVPKCCAPKCAQKPCVQKLCAPKCCAPKCVQKSICAPKCCAPKCVQKPCVSKGCCQKGPYQKGGCGSRRGLLLGLGLGLFQRGTNCSCCQGGSYPTAAPHNAVPGELPTPTVEGSDPFGDDPNPLRPTSVARRPQYGPGR